MKEQDVFNREWFDSALAAMEDTCRLYREKKLPRSIEAWMLTVACRRVLRAIYGSDSAADEVLRRWTAEEIELAAAYKDVTDIQ